MSDLISWLRSNYPKGGMYPSVYEAADALESQAKRIAQLEARDKELIKRIAELKSENRRLKDIPMK
jgi:cell division protein FtsB